MAAFSLACSFMAAEHQVGVQVTALFSGWGRRFPLSLLSPSVVPGSSSVTSSLDSLLQQFL